MCPPQNARTPRLPIAAISLLMHVWHKGRFSESMQLNVKRQPSATCKHTYKHMHWGSPGIQKSYMSKACIMVCYRAQHWVCRKLIMHAVSAIRPNMRIYQLTELPLSHVSVNALKCLFRSKTSRLVSQTWTSPHQSHGRTTSSHDTPPT